MLDLTIPTPLALATRVALRAHDNDIAFLQVLHLRPDAGDLTDDLVAAHFRRIDGTKVT